MTTNSDPSGTGYTIYNYNGGRADRVTGVDPYAGQSLTKWMERVDAVGTVR